MMTAAPPENLKTSDDMAYIGVEISIRFRIWWEESRNTDFSKLVPTYFGKNSRHELLERTVWHSIQHVRQIESLLDSINEKYKFKINKEQMMGLPLSEKIWDN